MLTVQPTLLTSITYSDRGHCDRRASSARRSPVQPQRTSGSLRRSSTRGHFVTVSAAQQSPYEVLGIKSDASLSDIKKAFRQRALKVHPDVNKQANAAAEFQACKDAYQTLSDSAKRKNFDQRQRSRTQSSGAASDGFDWRGWASESAERAKEPFYGFTEFFKDVEADINRRQKKREAEPKSLYQELSDLGEEFVEWLEGGVGGSTPKSKQSPEQQAKTTAMEAEAKAQAEAAKAKKSAEDDIEEMLRQLKNRNQ